MDTTISWRNSEWFTCCFFYAELTKSFHCGWLAVPIGFYTGNPHTTLLDSLKVEGFPGTRFKGRHQPTWLAYSGLLRLSSS